EAPPQPVAGDEPAAAPPEQLSLVRQGRQVDRLDHLEPLRVRDHDLAVDGREVEPPLVEQTVVNALVAQLDRASRLLERDCVALVKARRPELRVEIEDVVRMGPMRL